MWEKNWDSGYDIFFFGQLQVMHYIVEAKTNKEVTELNIFNLK